MQILNNADLMRKFVPDSQVLLECSDHGELKTPDWVKSLIIVQASIFTAADQGTFQSGVRLLDHLQEMGVNGLWLTPVYGGDHYGNHGLHTIDNKLVGTADYDAGTAVLREYVQKAHERNIRVFFDVVHWGTHKEAPLYKQRPDWYNGTSEYGGWCFDWNNPELCEWYSSALVRFIIQTNADGFRVDCAPGYAGYDPYRVARTRLLNIGRKIMLFSESASERKGVFDFDEHHTDIGGHGATGEKWQIGDSLIRQHHIVDLVKTGQGLGAETEQKLGVSTNHRFFCFLVSCHDRPEYTARQSPIVMGYQALFSPFIPLWYLGEEWDNSFEKIGYWALFGTRIHWDEIEKNRPFFELVKKMIRIRRENKDIFENFPERIRDTNLCKVETDLAGGLQAYGRYLDRKAFLIVPNHTASKLEVTVQIPLVDLKWAEGSEVQIHDALEDRPIGSGRLGSFRVSIAAGGLGVYRVDRAG